jgi:hypothetical protein
VQARAVVSVSRSEMVAVVMGRLGFHLSPIFITTVVNGALTVHSVAP